MEQDRGKTMTSQAKKLIRHGFVGLVFGVAFYLIISSIANLFLDWFIPFANQQFPFDEPFWVKAIYAVALTLSWGIRVPLHFISANLSLLLTSVISGAIGMVSFLIKGIRKGLIIFIILSALLILAIACPAIGMITSG